MHEYGITSSSLLPLPSFMQQSTPQSILNDLKSKASTSSCGTVCRTRSPKTAGSTRSRESLASNRLRVRNENVPSSRDASHFSLPKTPTPSLRRTQRHRKSSWASESPLSSRLQSAPSPLSDTGPLEDIDLNSIHQTEDVGDHELSFDIKGEETLSTPRRLSATSQETGPTKRFVALIDHPFSNGRPFRKWVGSLHHQRRARRRTLTAREERWTLDDLDDDDKPVVHTTQYLGRSGHQKSSSWSPSGFVNLVKSATSNLAPSHPTTRSRRYRGSYLLRSNRNSSVSNNQDGTPADEVHRQISFNDQAACDRAVQRRRVLEELISSEESYVADLKVLLHVYVFILDSAPKVAQATQPGVSRNVGEMLHLHEEILLEIKMLISKSDPRPSNNDVGAHRRSKHGRWHNPEAEEGMHNGKATRAGRRSFDMPWFGWFKHQPPAMVPEDAANIANVFERMLPRFFIYEEYGARYESMLLNMASLSRTMPTWSAYERGIESLVNSLIPQNIGSLGSKKGLTLEDLLIKPIQRVCKYPLLFAELFKHTPAIDDPEAKAEVEKVYLRLRETAHGINKATNDLQTQVKIQRSWRLQDLLVFSETCPAPFALRQLGHASLCGALYVAYQSKDEVLGNYMFCALFKAHLLLAVPRSGKLAFEIVAIIGLDGVQLDNADNGKGLQCHTAPYCWKLVFESDQQLYELVLCACTAREEQQWKADILAHTSKETTNGFHGPKLLDLLSFESSVLCLDIKSLGPVFGLPGTLIRRQSIQRAVTVNSRRNARQVIVKNTYSLKENGDSTLRRSGTLKHSKSLMSTNQIPLLAPRRGERQRIEQRMSEVWTKDRLPYPGMTGHRGGHLIRTSANSVMRKLSMASSNTTVSFAGSVKQRTVTYGSIAEGNPFTGEAAGLRTNQTDGASSPSAENPHSYPETLRSTFEYYEPYAVSQATSPTPDGSEMTYVTKFRKDSSGTGKGHSRGLSETPTIVASRDSKEVEHEKEKARKNKRLLKAFSTEGIRNWFHH